MLKKTKTTILFVFAALLLSSAIFFYELVVKKRQLEAENQQKQLIEFDTNEINYIVIERLARLEKNPTDSVETERIVLQKNQSGWNLIEPIQDLADQNIIDSILDGIKSQSAKKLNIESTDLSDYKMGTPSSIWIIKTATGKSAKVIVSQENNFEGYPFIMMANSTNINLGGSFWKSMVNQSMTYFRNKKLLRLPIEMINRVQVQSLSNKVDLVNRDAQWSVAGNSEMALDQTKVKDFLLRLNALEVSEYLSDGEPSQSQIRQKGLDKNYVQVGLFSTESNWSAKFQLDEKTNSLYGLTDRPTQMLKLDLLNWEMLANLNTDQFRDRSSAFAFNPSEVQKFFVKTQAGELELLKKSEWKIERSSMSGIDSRSDVNQDQLEKFLKELSRQELTYFLEKSDYGKLVGTNMIILKSANDQLLLQLNWGPQSKRNFFSMEREFYFARTQVSPMVFGMSLESINKILDFKFIKKEIKE
jgi:hypothetical protein